MTVAAAELWRLSASELAEAIRSGQASSQEVMEAHLRRIDAVNPAVNAVVIVLGDQALEAARAADRVVAAGAAAPVLHGVPFTVKGNIDVVGTPTTQGLTAMANAYPTRDAPWVERMKRAGDHRRPYLARPVDRPGATPRSGTPRADPRRARARPGRGRDGQARPGRRPQGREGARGRHPNPDLGGGLGYRAERRDA
jgi:hypothetical protein